MVGSSRMISRGSARRESAIPTFAGNPLISCRSAPDTFLSKSQISRTFLFVLAYDFHVIPLGLL